MKSIENDVDDNGNYSFLENSSSENIGGAKRKESVLLKVRGNWLTTIKGFEY